MADKKMTIRILAVVIVILVLALVYVLAIRPAVSGFVVNKQVDAYTQGQTDFLNAMLVQLQQNGYTQITVGNQSIVLVPYNPSPQQ